MNDFKTTVIGCAFALIAIGLPQTALADRIIVPATVCQIWGGQAPEFTDNIQYSKFGRVYNTSTTTNVSVVCPVPRHESKTRYRVDVYYTDLNPATGKKFDLACSLRSNLAFGENVYDFDGVTSSAEIGGFGGDVWHFDVIAKNGDYPTNLVLQCNLPPHVSSEDESSIGSMVVYPTD